MKKPYTYKRLKEGILLAEKIEELYPGPGYNILDTAVSDEGYWEMQKFAFVLIMKYLKRDGFDAQLYEVPKVNPMEDEFDAREERIESMYEIAWEVKQLCHKLLEGTSWNIETYSVMEMAEQVIPEKYKKSSTALLEPSGKETEEVIEEIKKWAEGIIKNLLPFYEKKLADIAIDQYNEYYYFGDINIYINRKIPVFLENLKKHERNAAKPEERDIKLIRRIIKPLCMERKNYFPLADDYMSNMPNGIIKPRGRRKEHLLYTFIGYETEDAETVDSYLYRPDAFFLLVLLEHAMQYMEYKYPSIYKGTKGRNEGKKVSV